MKPSKIILSSIALIFIAGCDLENAQEEPIDQRENIEQENTIESEELNELPDDLEGIGFWGTSGREIEHSYLFTENNLIIFDGDLRGYNPESYQEKYLETIESVQVTVVEDEYNITAEGFELNLVRIGKIMMRNLDNGDEYTIIFPD